MPVYQQVKTNKQQNNRFTIIVRQMDPGYNKEIVLLYIAEKGWIFLELRNLINFISASRP